MIMAHFINETEGSADSALELLFTALNQKRRVQSEISYPRGYHTGVDCDATGKSRPILKPAVLPALLKIQQELMSGRYSATCPKLFDRFVTTRQNYFKGSRPQEMEHDVAMLLLVHPGQPPPETAFLHWQRLDGRPGDVVDPGAFPSLLRAS